MKIALTKQYCSVLIQLKFETKACFTSLYVLEVRLILFSDFNQSDIQRMRSYVPGINWAVVHSFKEFAVMMNQSQKQNGLRNF